MKPEYEDFEQTLRAQAGADGKTRPLKFEEIKAITGNGDMITMHFMRRFERNHTIGNTAKGYIFHFDQ